MYAIEALSLTKRFGPVVANHNVSLQVEQASVHGIIGENGAGKSTLMNLLYGFHRPDSGDIRVRGEPVRLKGPEEAIAKGLGMVHQHFMLVEPFTVLENIVLGFEGEALLAGSLDQARKKLIKIEHTYGLVVDPDARVCDLPVGDRQRVEILKSLYRGAETLILDEPTGVLTPQETASLFEVIATLRTEGKTILLITHKLGEIMAITDRVSVMRGGEMISHHETSETSAEDLAERMVGRTVIRETNKTETAPGEVLLKVDNLFAEDDTGKKQLKGISFDVRGGEILGIAGVSGNGQSELLEVLTGMRTPSQGTVEFKGSISAAHGHKGRPQSLRTQGLGHVAEDRHRIGMIGPMSAEENTILGYQRDPKYTSGPILSPANMRQHCATLMRDHDVRPQTPELPLQSFSGGNQQKLVIAREMEQHPDLLVVGQPTRGVDIGAIAFIHSRLIEMRNQGKAVLIVSSELDEIMTLADRIIVLCDGIVTGQGRPADFNERDIGLMMAGEFEEAAS